METFIAVLGRLLVRIVFLSSLMVLFLCLGCGGVKPADSGATLESSTEPLTEGGERSVGGEQSNSTESNSDRRSSTEASSSDVVENLLPHPDDPLSNARGILMIGIKDRGKTFMVPAKVVERRGDVAYVVVRLISKLLGVDVRTKFSDDVEFMAIWKSPDGRRTVPVKRIGVYPENLRWIFTAPADEVPRPLTSGLMRDATKGDKVAIVHWGMYSPRGEPTVSWSLSYGEIAEMPNPAFNGNNNRWKIRADDVQSILWGVVLSEAGILLGEVGDPAGRFGVKMWNLDPVDLAEGALDPIAWCMMSAPKGGDRNSKQFELVFHVTDHLGEFQSPVAYVGRNSLAERLGYARGRAVGPLIENAIALNLVRGEPSEYYFRVKQKNSSAPSGGEFYVGTFSAELPANASDYITEVQLSFTNGVGERVYFARNSYTFDVREHGAHRLPPPPPTP